MAKTQTAFNSWLEDYPKKEPNEPEAGRHGRRMFRAVRETNPEGEATREKSRSANTISIP
jgi:hypothetical protein